MDDDGDLVAMRYDNRKIGFPELRAEGLMMVPAQMMAGRFLSTFIGFPPRQKAAGFTLPRVMEKLQPGAPGAA